MKSYLIKFILCTVLYITIVVILDAAFHSLQTVTQYALKGVLCSAAFVTCEYLNDKGWNSWKKVASIFKKKDAAEMRDQ